MSIAQNNMPIKAKIIVELITGNLIDEKEFLKNYNANIEIATKEFIQKYSLFELVEKEFKIKKITLLR